MTTWLRLILLAVLSAVVAAQEGQVPATTAPILQTVEVPSCGPGKNPCDVDAGSDVCLVYREKCGRAALGSSTSVNTESTEPSVTATSPTVKPAKHGKPKKQRKPNRRPKGKKHRKPHHESWDLLRSDDDLDAEDRKPKPQKPTVKPPHTPKPAKPSKPSKPPAKPAKPSQKPQKPHQKPQKPAGTPGKPQTPTGKPQKPATSPGKPQKPHRPQAPSKVPMPDEPANEQPLRPNGCVGSAQACNCDCCSGFYCVDGSVPGTGRTCLKLEVPPPECKKNPNASGISNVNGQQQLHQGAGSIPVVGSGLQQGANTATTAGAGGNQGNPVIGAG